MPRALEVRSPRNELLACVGLAGNQNGRRRATHLAHLHRQHLVLLTCRNCRRNQHSGSGGTGRRWPRRHTADQAALAMLNCRSWRVNFVVTRAPVPGCSADCQLLRP